MSAIKKLALCILLLILLQISMQSKAQPLKQEANRLVTNKEYCKAIEYYEKAIKQDETMDNYSYYAAAQAACQCGQTDKAIQFYKEGFKIAVDFTNYSFFKDDTLNNCFSKTEEWKSIIKNMARMYDSSEAKIEMYLADINDSNKKINESLLTDTNYWKGLSKKSTVGSLISKIMKFNNYPIPPITNRWVLYYYKVNDTLTMPYLVYIPKEYKPKIKTPLYIYLHGAVRRKFLSVKDVYLPKHEAPFLDNPINQNAFIIYPFANKSFNWLFHQEAFDAIIAELRHVKSLYNIDDNKVYINGHSNGGSGAFWFAVNNRTNFAGFAGLCYNPSSYMGNTSLRNLNNESTFWGITDNQGGIFNFKEVDDLAKKTNKNWVNYIVAGGHDLPYKSPASISFLYDTLIRQKRNPYPIKIEWEIDNIKNGRCYWIEINELDTLSVKESWAITEPVATNIDKSNKYADFYKNKSGTILAEIKNNILTVKTSCVKTFTFYVTPDLINLDIPLKIYVNNNLMYNSKVKTDKKILLEEFLNTKDRSLLVLTKIKILL